MLNLDNSNSIIKIKSLNFKKIIPISINNYEYINQINHH